MPWKYRFIGFTISLKVSKRTGNWAFTSDSNYSLNIGHLIFSHVLHVHVCLCTHVQSRCLTEVLNWLMWNKGYFLKSHLWLTFGKPWLYVFVFFSAIRHWCECCGQFVWTRAAVNFCVLTAVRSCTLLMAVYFAGFLFFTVTIGNLCLLLSHLSLAPTLASSSPQRTLHQWKPSEGNSSRLFHKI